MCLLQIILEKFVSGGVLPWLHNLILEVYFLLDFQLFFWAWEDYNTTGKSTDDLKMVRPLHTTFVWNIIIQWTSHDDLTEKNSCFISLVKLVKWQKFKTAICDLTEKLLVSNFVRMKIWLKSSNQSGSQTHGWILLNFFFFLYYINF